jgi:hypothetical protein
MKILSQRVKAAEAGYFKPENEEAILRRRDQLVKDGKLQSVTMPGKRHSGDVLPEILSHEMVLNTNRAPQEYVRTKGYNVVIPKQSDMAKYAKEFTRPSIYDSLGAKELKSARDKWKGTTQDGTSIFDVSAARQLMLENEKKKSMDRKARLVHVGPKPLPPQVVRVAGVPIIAVPEPTAGRALLWGTILAVWTGSVCATYTCRALDIKTAEDIGPAFREAMSPLAGYFFNMGSGLREKVLNGELAMDTSSVSYKLRETLHTTSR